MIEIARMNRAATTARVLGGLLVAAWLAGCAAPPPAPVESRTRPATPAARPAAPQPAQATAQPDAGVQARPIPSTGVQVRPLPGATEPRVQSAPGGLRTQPQGLKKPYSDAALAEMRGAAGADARPSADTKPAPDPKVVTDPKPEAKPAPEARAGAPAEAAVSLAWPARGRVIQAFSEPKSMGISIAGAPGDPVSAAGDGRVIFSGPGPKGYGNLLIVKHDGDVLTVYAHNRALLVKDGAQVRRGQQIAELGDTGTDRPKLHFEVRRNGKPVDPATMLPPR